MESGVSQDEGRNRDVVFLIREARVAREKGDIDTTEAFMRSIVDIYKKPEDNQRSTPHVQIIGLLITLLAKQLRHLSDDCGGSGMKDGKIIKQGEVSFVPGVIPEYSGFCGFPMFYHKNVKSMHRSVPLRIFDPVWQQQAVAFSTTKRSTMEKSSSNEKQYTGIPAPDEWSQSHIQWCRYWCYGQLHHRRLSN